MSRFVVRDITNHGALTIVQLDPQKVKLFMEDKVVPGCIQHIIFNLSKDCYWSKDLCDKMCEILCKIDMDDYSSRKRKKYIYS